MIDSFEKIDKVGIKVLVGGTIFAGVITLGAYIFA